MTKAAIAGMNRARAGLMPFVTAILSFIIIGVSFAKLCRKHGLGNTRQHKGNKHL